MPDFVKSLTNLFKKKDKKVTQASPASTMSKPDKYKDAAEKGVGVPGTSNNDSQWKPYTIPYTGAGAQRTTGGDWTPQRPQTTQRRMESPAVPSHAAPPLYINRETKEQASEKGKESTSDKKDERNEQQQKKAADQRPRLVPSCPSSYKKSQDRK